MKKQHLTNPRTIAAWVAAMITLLSTSAAHGQVLVAEYGYIGEYSTSGATINADLISGVNDSQIAISGSDLFVAGGGTVAEYSLSGSTATLVNPDLITVSGGFNPGNGIAVSGSDLYVLSEDGTIGEYTLGATPGTITSSTPSLITPFNPMTSTGTPGAGYNSFGLAISGPDLFVVNSDRDPGQDFISEFNTSGASVNPSLITGLTNDNYIAIAGSDLFESNFNGVSPTVGEYTTSGGTVNANLISAGGSFDGGGLALSGSDLFLVNDASSTSGGYGTIAEYTLSGTMATLVTSDLITGLNGPEDIVIADIAAVPEPSTWAMMFVGLLALVGWQRFQRRKV